MIMDLDCVLWRAGAVAYVQQMMMITKRLLKQTEISFFTRFRILQYRTENEIELDWENKNGKLLPSTTELKWYLQLLQAFKPYNL